MQAEPQAALVVFSPTGQRSRLPLSPLPFTIGRQGDNSFVLRDNRASRRHARIEWQNGTYWIEDLESRHGTWINGQRIHRQPLRHGDRIELGLEDSYKLVFSLKREGFQRLMSKFSQSLRPDTSGGELAKLRSLVEVARALQHSLSTHEVLAAVVDAALTVTGSERGFLLLRGKERELEVSVGRNKAGRNLAASDLDFPISQLSQQLISRRELLSFDAPAAHGLRSICLPIIRVRGEGMEDTRAISTADDTIGLIYMDSREVVDLPEGSRELLETLAVEASTILENARLMEEERGKIRMEDEMSIARQIQSDLLPRSLPQTGWFRAAGSSVPSEEVGGDYFDVHEINGAHQTKPAWVVVVADVCGKGMSSALLASLLQGTFLMASADPSHMEARVARLNDFLFERTHGEKYATVFYGIVDSSGLLSYINAGLCEPMVISSGGTLRTLETTSLPPGMLPGTEFDMKQTQFAAGEKLVLYSDGLTDAANPSGQFFGIEEVRAVIEKQAHASAVELHEALRSAVEQFANGVPFRDDVTALVVEFQP